MKPKNRAEIWKQQKYNNSCAWDCFSMLLATHGVETTALDLVGASHIPYQLRLHPEEKRLSAGMLVQADGTVNPVLGRFGFHLNSRRTPTIAEYIALARETLRNGDALITNLKRPDNLPGRHAIVITELRESCFIGLDPDCRLDRATDYSYFDVEEIVALDFTEEELVIAASGEEGFVPLIGVLSPCTPQEPDSPLLQDVFKRSNDALEFYFSETEDLDFTNGESMQIIYSVIKPIVLDLRTAIEIRDEFLNQESEIASFLRGFESEILHLRKLVKNGKAIPEEIVNGLRDSLKRSYRILEEHLSFRAYRNEGK
ncbi:MAG: hypothetical protein GQ565_06680 [Candidatus Aegiribacteria sp.]|nr:hypothetical protein [Candidatus Aegiribacteria sp.]